MVCTRGLESLRSELGQWAQNQVDGQEWLVMQRERHGILEPVATLDATNPTHRQARRHRPRGGVKHRRGVAKKASPKGVAPVLGSEPDLLSELGKLAASEVQAAERLA